MSQRRTAQVPALGTRTEPPAQSPVGSRVATPLLQDPQRSQERTPGTRESTGPQALAERGLPEPGPVRSE